MIVSSNFVMVHILGKFVTMQWTVINTNCIVRRVSISGSRLGYGSIYSHRYPRFRDRLHGAILARVWADDDDETSCTRPAPVFGTVPPGSLAISLPLGADNDDHSRRS